MAGVALMLSAICINATLCPSQDTAPDINYIELLPNNTYESTNDVQNQLAKLAAELKGQTLNVTTLEDYPLSYVERTNGTFIGRGWAFEFFEFLMKKYDFKYNLVISDVNIVGSSNDSEGSLMQLMTKNVRKRFNFSFSSDKLRFILFSIYRRRRWGWLLCQCWQIWSSNKFFKALNSQINLSISQTCAFLNTIRRRRLENDHDETSRICKWRWSSRSLS